MNTYFHEEITIRMTNMTNSISQPLYTNKKSNNSDNGNDNI